MSHTPGPWHYAPDTRGRMRVYSGEREIVRALSTHGTRNLSKAEREANARLIAAAPEMLGLLKQARRRWIDAARAQEYWTPEEKDDLRRIEAAIAKATGGAQ